MLSHSAADSHANAQPLAEHRIAQRLLASDQLMLLIRRTSLSSDSVRRAGLGGAPKAGRRIVSASRASRPPISMYAAYSSPVTITLCARMQAPYSGSAVHVCDDAAQPQACI